MNNLEKNIELEAANLTASFQAKCEFSRTLSLKRIADALERLAKRRIDATTIERDFL